MIQKLRGVVLLVTFVALLVVISARIPSDGSAAVPAGAAVTDDPLPPATTDPVRTIEPVEETAEVEKETPEENKETPEE